MYEPGSTFKVLLAAAAIESVAVRPTDPLYCPGSLRVAGRVIRDAEQQPGGHGPQAPSDIIKNSCNVGGPSWAWPWWATALTTRRR